MKKLFLVSALLSSVPVQAFEFPAIPSLKEQYENAKMDQVIQYFETDPFFAGKEVTVHLFGRRVPVNRTPETPVPGARQPDLANLEDVLTGLDAGVRGEAKVHIKREWYENGLIKSEDWHITLGGGVAITKQPQPEPEKKKTGEENNN